MAPGADADLNADMLVADVMRRWPSTIEVFLSHRMACPGCPMAPFVTLGEAARSYALDLPELLAMLRMQT